MNNSKAQTILLVILRMLIGWHLLYEGIFKIIHPEWSSAGFLEASQGFMSGFSNWILSNESLLNAADLLNKLGLTAIGLGLILGLFTRAAAWAGAALLLIYYFVNPPFIGFDQTIFSEGNYLVVNKTLIETAALMVIALFRESSRYGLDTLLRRKKD